jgi:hypothetical protein
MKLGHANNTEHAESLGNLMIEEKLFAHVTNEHGLQNKYLFYRFSDLVYAPEADNRIVNRLRLKTI